MSYSMYLDDINHPKSDFDVVVRSYEEAVEWILKNGIPSFISFDNDLKYDISYDLAKWLVQSSLDGTLHFPQNFSFCVNNGDAVTRNNIKALLNNYLHFNFIYR